MRSKFLKLLIFAVPLVLVVAIFSACSDNKAKNSNQKYQIITVNKKASNTVLYLSGTINPLDIVNVPSPADGTVAKIYFHYGQTVKKNDILLTINSNKLMEQYQDALTGYLKAKDSYLNNKLKMEGSEDLYKSGLISRNEYEQDRSALADAYLSYNESQSKLQTILVSTKGYLTETEDLTNLTIEDIDKVRKALAVNLNELTIRSPTYGIILMPLKDDDSGSGSGDTKQLKEGSSVKENGTLVSIGDFKGLSIKVNINEININFIQPGQKVVVTGVAFPNITLQGHVSSVDVQAVSSDSGGLPTFPVTVVVPNLTEKQRETIHIGMSAQVELTVEGAKQIIVPIKAVIQKDNVPFVEKVISEKPLKTKLIQVVTGQPDVNEVVIKEGLQVGDKILVNH